MFFHTKCSKELKLLSKLVLTLRVIIIKEDQCFKTRREYEEQFLNKQKGNSYELLFYEEQFANIACW